MLVQKWMLPTLKEILNWKFDQVQSWCSDNSGLSSSQLQAQAAQEWKAAVAATEDLLLQSIESKGDRSLSPQGVVFAGSSPLWSNDLLTRLQTGIFVEQSTENSPQLPPAKATISSQSATPQQLPLLNNDPLAQEPFCLILTAKFSLLLVLGCDSSGNQGFRFSFEPEEAAKVWQLLRSRLLLTNSLLVDEFDTLVKKFEPVAPDYRVVTNFSHLLLKHSHLKPPQTEPLVAGNHRSDIELLQAFAHEVRTPLTTIRTLTRLLLKRKDLAPEVKKR
nr:sensor histidine kinase [Tatlockia sp.]